MLVRKDEQQHRCPGGKFPESAREGTSLRVLVEGGEILPMQTDQEERDTVRRRIQKTMDRLRARGRRAT